MVIIWNGWRLVMGIFVDISLFLIDRLFFFELFEMFIDVGYYVRELNVYKFLVDKIFILMVNIKRVLVCWMLICLFNVEKLYRYDFNRYDFLILKIFVLYIEVVWNWLLEIVVLFVLCFNFVWFCLNFVRYYVLWEFINNLVIFILEDK